MPLTGTTCPESDFPDMDEGELRHFVLGHRWTFARTMPRQPHEYLLAPNATSLVDFYRFVMTVRRFGYDEFYKTQLMRYYDLDDCKYWTMGEHLTTTYVLNRARIYRPPRPRIFNPIPFKPRAGNPHRWKKRTA